MQYFVRRDIWSIFFILNKCLVTYSNFEIRYSLYFLTKNEKVKSLIWSGNSDHTLVPRICLDFLPNSVYFFWWRNSLSSFLCSSCRGGVEDTRLEAKAKDTKKIRGQGQGQPFRGQTLSRPRTGMLEAKAKDQGHKRKCSSKKKKKIFTKIFQAISKKKKKVFIKIF